MYELVISIGMFLGMPYKITTYEFPSKEECIEAKAEYIKDYNLKKDYTIICVPIIKDTK